MTTTTLDTQHSPAADAEQQVTDRRRPGRPETVSPKLIPLLRAEERAKLPELVDPPELADRIYYPDDRRLDAGQGLVLGLGIGALMWAALISAGWAIFAG